MPKKERSWGAHTFKNNHTIRQANMKNYRKRPYLSRSIDAKRSSTSSSSTIRLPEAAPAELEALVEDMTDMPANIGRGPSSESVREVAPVIGAEEELRP